MHKYFCGCCGHHFESAAPERDANGYLNEIACPDCGAHDIYADTPDGAEQSVKDQTAYENKLIEQEEDAID
jgi:DNA-directed RNA polymerase subunit RPC12/RpoP